MNRKEFVEKYKEIVCLATQLGEKARRESILGLSDKLDDIPAENDRDIFKYGLKFAIDGLAYEYIDKILTNLVNQEKDEDKRLLKTMQKEAVLMIQQGFNPRLIPLMLNSYTDISLAEHEAILGTLDDDKIEDEEIPVENDTGKLDIFATTTDRNIKIILRNIDVQILAMALKGTSKNTREAFFRNMSERAAEMLKEDMKYMGPVELSGVEEAQDKILELIEAEGIDAN